MKNFLGKFLLCIIIIFLVLIFYNLTEVKAAGGNFYITVNNGSNVVTVYKDGVPIKSMVCSTRK